MDNDAWGRSISVGTADSIDTYTIVDSQDGNFSFTLPFPTGTSTDFVYSIVNQYEPRQSSQVATGCMGQGFLYSIQGDDGNMPTGNTSDRITPFEVFGSVGSVGLVYFDQTLNKPIWYVGWGPTGWVDATGAQV